MKIIGCFDGGGARGRFSLAVSHLLATTLLPKRKISSLFSLVIGTSVGSWVAAVIAMGMLDTTESLHQIYQDMLIQLPDTLRSQNEIGAGLIQTKYDGKGKTQLLQRVFSDKKIGDAIIPLCVTACSMGGKPRRYRSWDPDDQNTSLVEILDAASAPPVFFPPVRVDDHLTIDGGVNANSPIVSALICAIQLWDKGDRGALLKSLKLLSVGTHAICELDVPKEKLQELGLVAWINLGIFDMLTGQADDTGLILASLLLGEENVFRIHCECAGIKMDDLSSESVAKINNSVTETWKRKASSLIQFLT
jgi:Patatin-like phospholipase